jgi:hypothetical protein
VSNTSAECNICETSWQQVPDLHVLGIKLKHSISVGYM